MDRTWNVGLIGAGNIGSALVSYKEFQKQGFNIRAIFDNDQRKIGSNHKGIIISDVNDLVSEVKKHKLEIVVIAVPASAAQRACDLAVAAGVKAILNFAPINLKVPSDVVLRTENMAMEIEYLSFYLTNRTRIDRAQ
jgi:redox-sensing transcriptional repressor